MFVNKNKLRNKTTGMEILLDLKVDIVAINLYYLKPSFLLVTHLDDATLLLYLLFSVSSIYHQKFRFPTNKFIDEFLGTTYFSMLFALSDLWVLAMPPHDCPML